MSACTILPDMRHFEEYVNVILPCNRPSREGEPLEIVLPQRFNPIMMSKKERKETGRRFQVSLIFVAALWRAGDDVKDCLKWKYHDVKVTELV